MKRILTLLAMTSTLALSAGAQDADEAQATPETEQELIDPASISYALNGEEFSLAYLLQFTRLLVSDPNELELETAYPILAELSIEQDLAAMRAQEIGLADQPGIQLELRLLINSFLSNIYLEQETTARLTEDLVQATYAGYVENFVPQETATASHILLASDADARGAIERLQNGEDFAALAQELSTGPSGPDGGDLGTFPRGAMVAPFEEAVFAMAPGDYSLEPVETQFGFHVILLRDLAEDQPEALETIREPLVESLLQQIQDEIRAELRRDANYQIVPFAELGRSIQEVEEDGGLLDNDTIEAETDEDSGSVFNFEGINLN